MFIKKTKMHKATTAQYLLEKFLTAADSVNVENSEPNSKQFHLVWISGHSGVQGNKKVDEEAKKEAQAVRSGDGVLNESTRKNTIQLYFSWL